MIDNSTKDKLEHETPHFGNTLLGAVLLTNSNKMTGKEAIKKAIELVEKEKMMRYDSRKGKTDRQKYAIDAVVSTLVNVQIMLQNLDKQVVE